MWSDILIIFNHIERIYLLSESHLMVCSIFRVHVPVEFAEEGSDQLCQDCCIHRSFTGRHWFMSPDSLHIYQRDIFGVVDMWHHWRFSFFYSKRRAGNTKVSFRAWGKGLAPIETNCWNCGSGLYIIFKALLYLFSCLNLSHILSAYKLLIIVSQPVFGDVLWVF